jgi:hypothetical protein
MTPVVPVVESVLSIPFPREEMSPSRGPVSCSDAEVVECLREREAVMRRALAEQLAYVAEAERRGLYADSGARSARVWLRRLLNLSEEDAKARVEVACAVQERVALDGSPLPAELPATAEVLRDGEMSLAHARAINDGMGKLPSWAGAQERADAERLLARQARTFSPKQVRVLAERVRYLMDQDGALADEDEQVQRRELHFGVGRDGMTVLKGRLDRETGAKLQAALESLAAPRPERDGEKDSRSAGQRNADAFADLLDIALGADDLPRAGGQRPHLNVTIDFDSLRAQLASQSSLGGTLENAGQPITAEQVRRMACDAEVLPIVLGGDGQPLDVGRSQRTAPPHVRAALLARDGGCSFPGCDRPPGTSEAHHLAHWIDGGSTSLDNMTMLCAHHHRVVHRQGWDIDLASGRPMFTPPSTVDPAREARPGGRPQHQPPLAFTG